MYRQKIHNQSLDKKIFSQTADRTHKWNVQARPMRGGYRL
jgi:hypothetical protein